MIPDELLAAYFQRCMMFGSVGMFIAYVATEATAWPGFIDVVLFVITGAIQVGVANAAAEYVNDKHNPALRGGAHR